MRVLIVEDDLDVRSGLLEVLRMSGIDASAVGDAEAALVRMRSDPEITVMLTDMYMPGTDGMKLTASVRQSRPDAIALEVVVLSGASFGLDNDVAHGLFFAVLRKPAQVKPLLAALRGAHHAAIGRRQDSGT
jgi:CheY-like chemotaxis protein